jgi:hypothetical protein
MFSKIAQSKEDPLSIWKTEELDKIAATDDLHISPYRKDGKTLGTPTWIWSVVVDGSLFVRAYNGQASSWYQAAREQKAGRITAGGLTKEVVFKLLGNTDQERIDAAYKAKYSKSPYLAPMLGDRARSATVEITPA